MLVPATLKYNNTSEPNNSYPVTSASNAQSWCASISISESPISSGLIPITTVFPLHPASASFFAFAGGNTIVVLSNVRETLSPSTLHFVSMKFICGEPMNPATNKLFGSLYNFCGESTCMITPSFNTTILVPSVIASV